MQFFPANQKTMDILASAFDPVFIIIPLIILVIGSFVFFIYRQRSPIILRKVVRGRSITLIIKNKTKEYYENAMIIDSVPRGAFINCRLLPRIDNAGNIDYLTWSAALNPGEEVKISYQSKAATPSFSIRIGVTEYESGKGLFGLF